MSRFAGGSRLEERGPSGSGQQGAAMGAAIQRALTAGVLLGLTACAGNDEYCEPILGAGPGITACAVISCATGRALYWTRCPPLLK